MPFFVDDTHSLPILACSQNAELFAAPSMCSVVVEHGKNVPAILARKKAIEVGKEHFTGYSVTPSCAALGREKAKLPPCRVTTRNVLTSDPLFSSLDRHNG
jgi:hypothetical protein